MNQDTLSPNTPSQPRSLRFSPNVLLILILSVYGVMGIWFSIVVPPFETPDEIYHYAFARYVAAGNGLPVQGESSTGPWEQEGSQAPLYYIITGALTAPIDQSDFDTLAAVNPRGNIGDPLYPGNKNRMLYSSVRHPLLGTNLALHVGRWFSLVLGACTLLLLYGTANFAFPNSDWLPVVALVLVAFMPQFIFISASFTNDSMVIVMSAAVVYWLARLLTGYRDRDVRMHEWMILGVLLGLAALSKLQALGLVVLASGVAVFIAWQKRSWRLFFTAAIATAIPALLIAGWWYWRNMALYGDWTGLQHLIALNGLRTDSMDIDDFWREFRGLRYSFWGLFGWFNILLPVWFYTIMDVVTVTAIVGAIATVGTSFAREHWSVIKRTEGQVRLMLFVWIGLSSALLLYWMMRALGSQGRLLFPAVTAIAVWIVISLNFWISRVPRRLQGLLWGLLPALLLAMSIYATAYVIPAAYAAPAPADAIPESATEADITYGDEQSIRLLAYETPDRRYRPGDVIPLTLYLASDGRLDDDLQLFIQLLGVNGDVLANITSNPGWGRNPTSLWSPDAIYADEYALRLDQRIDDRSPLLANLYIGFVDPDTLSDEKLPLSALNTSGDSITPLMGEIVIEPLNPPDLDEYITDPMSVEFADGIALTGITLPATVSASEPLSVTVAWQATATPSTDYTAFVHVLDDMGEFIAGYDLPPANGRLPTRLWRVGDSIISEVAITMPDGMTAGSYEVWVGLYDSASDGAERLSIFGTGGQTMANNMVMLGAVDVPAQSP